VDKLVSHYNELKLEDGDTAVYPLKPFGPGFVLDQTARQYLRRDLYILLLLSPPLLCLFPYLLPVNFALYYYAVYRRRKRRVPAIPVRRWAEIQGWETPRYISFLGIVACTLGAGTGGWLLSLSPDPLLLPFIWIVMILSCLIGIYQTWMFRARGRAVRQEW
jgi:uncharacterized membrane protein YfcA